MMYKIFCRLNRNELIILSILIILLIFSFVHGWYFDTSKPQSGIGWADQTYYYNITKKLATGIHLSKADFHYQMGYSLLGAIFYNIIPTDPFMPVSFLLLISSMLFLYLGALNYLNIFFTFLFMLVLFYRFGNARELYYAQEIFLIPWNNQVLFFCFSYYFFAFSIKDRIEAVPKKVIYISAAIAGYTVSSRQEALIFVAPLFLALAYKNISFRELLASILLFTISYAPHSIIQYLVFENAFSNVRGTDQGVGYLDKLATYTDFGRLKRNFMNVIYNSSYNELPNINRLALLQANPLYWLTPLGLILLIVKSRPYLLLYVIISISLFVFYLSGENVSPEKLKFHCLRYLSPSFISLSFLSVYSLVILKNYVENFYLRHYKNV